MPNRPFRHAFRHRRSRPLPLALLLMTVGLPTCGDRFEVEAIHLDPASPLAVGMNARISVRVRYPPDDVLYVWRTENGFCQPQKTGALSTTYTARRAGKEHIRLEALHEGRIVLVAEREIEILEAGAPDASAAPPRSSAISGSQAPTVVISLIPPYDAIGSESGIKTARIEGMVSGARPEQRLVLYACTNTCYVQPLVGKPFTSISPSGAWSNWTHLGKSYAALLVEPDFEPEPVLPTAAQRMRGVVARRIVEGSRRTTD